jgi:hypothetical protein
LVRQRFDTNGTAGILKVTCRFPIAFWMFCIIPVEDKKQISQ